MKIVHHPAGTHPYVDTGYDRIPVQPIAGENLCVRAVVEDSEGPVEAWLHLFLNGAFSRVPGQISLRPDDDRVFLSFRVEAAEDCGELRYSIRAQDNRGSCQSREYHTEYCQRKPLGAARGVYRLSETSILVDFETVLLALSLDQVLSVKWLCPAGIAVAEEARVLEGSVLLRKGEMELQVQDAPFIWVLKRLGKQVASWAAADVSLLFDRDGRVQGITSAPCLAGERFYGLGERFDGVQRQGKSVEMQVVEKFTKQGDASYLPIPFLLTDQKAAWLGRSLRHMRIDLRQGFSFEAATANEDLLFEEFYLAGSPLQSLATLHRLTGAPALPPEWVFGVWISSNGWDSQQEVMDQLAALTRLALPASVMVLEAWSDENTFYIFNDAQYLPKQQEEDLRYEDFCFPADGRWPDPKAMAEAISQQGISLILWQIPVIKHVWEGPNKQLQMDEAEAIEKGYCIKNADGSPYRITDGWFARSLLLDFSNPDACAWWFSKRRYLLDALGVKGFKTDGGEFLFGDDAQVYGLSSGREAHNAYPGQYIGAYRDFLASHRADGICYSRAGALGAQAYPVHWAGDQLSTWPEFRAQLSAGLSAGLSGIPFWGFDIGGFAGDFPSAELYLRSLALGAFSPIMQWHSEPRDGQFYKTDRSRWNNDRSPWNLAEYHRNPDIIPIYRLFANLRMSLVPYLYQEARHCVETGRPMMAHLMLEWPEDPICLDIDHQYMLGRSLLVAPILQEGALEREVYLPSGIWHGLFTGQAHEGPAWVSTPCGLDAIPVFVREGSVLPMSIAPSLVLGGSGPECSFGGQTGIYPQLALMHYGRSDTVFSDQHGYRLALHGGRLTGQAPQPVLVIDATKTGKGAVVFGRSVAAQLLTPD